MVKEGQPIKQNQVIAVLDSGNTRYAEALQAQAQLQEAQSRLAQVRAGAKPGDIAAQQAEARRLAAELQNAQRDYQRYENLYRQGAISAADLDSRRLRLETTAQALEQARQQLNSVAEVRPTDIQQAQAQVQVAAANLQRAKTELDNSVVRSPIDGTVLKIHAYPGEQVGQDGIVELGRTQQMYAVAEVYETDVPRVKRGQRATISSPTFPNKLTGTVSDVGLQVRKNDVLNNDPAADVDARVVEVKIRLDDSKPVAGLTNLQVQVEIEPQ
jgi:HlyD family secretion protein